MKTRRKCDVSKSLSARRAWIEIDESPNYVVTKKVALRKESVDRNTKGVCLTVRTIVALRKESVDRNYWQRNLGMDDFTVALRKESVDRNCLTPARNSREARRSPQGERG